MDKMYDTLIEMYWKVLRRLNFGHELTPDSISDLWELVQAIECLKFGQLTNTEAHKILAYYV